MESERDHRNKADGEKWPSGNAMSIPMLAIITVGAHLLVALEHARELCGFGSVYRDLDGRRCPQG